MSDKVLTIEEHSDPDMESNWLEVHVRPFETEKSLEYCREYIHCDLIDIVEIEVDGHRYDVICDDEATLYGTPTLTLDAGKYGRFYGNLVFSRCLDGNEIGLEDEDIFRLKRFITERRRG